MRPSIIPGDVVFVNKLKLGPRTFRNLDFLDSDTVAVRNIRFPGYGSIKRNDVIVFNYPYADAWNKARFNYKAFYVKRCIGLPGDTLSIVNGFYKVSGQAIPLGNIKDQRKLSPVPIESLPVSISRTDRSNGWTIKKIRPTVHSERRGHYQIRRQELRILQAPYRVGNRRNSDQQRRDILFRRNPGGYLHRSE